MIRFIWSAIVFTFTLIVVLTLVMYVLSIWKLLVAWALISMVAVGAWSVAKNLYLDKQRNQHG